MDLSLILINASRVIYSFPKESKYTAAFLSVSNKVQCVHLLCKPSRFMTFAPYFILGKLSLAKHHET